MRPCNRDPRVCEACGEPVDIRGLCPAMRSIEAGVEELARRAES